MSALIIEWLKTNWRWFALAGCVVLALLLIRQNGKLAACQAEAKHNTVVTQYQVVTQTAQAKVIIRWRDKETPCPDVEVSANTSEGQTQGQAVTITPQPVNDAWKLNALLGASWRPGSMAIPSDGLPAWGASAGVSYGPVWAMLSAPAELSELGIRSANVSVGVIVPISK